MLTAIKNYVLIGDLNCTAIFLFCCCCLFKDIEQKCYTFSWISVVHSGSFYNLTELNNFNILMLLLRLTSRLPVIGFAYSTHGCNASWILWIVQLIDSLRCSNETANVCRYLRPCDNLNSKYNVLRLYHSVLRNACTQLKLSWMNVREQIN